MIHQLVDTWLIHHEFYDGGAPSRYKRRLYIVDNRSSSLRVNGIENLSDHMKAGNFGNPSIPHI
ncbi:MAG: hypothetical protein AB7J46_07545 [Candidatus Altimarinota bacterium]